MFVDREPPGPYFYALGPRSIILSRSEVMRRTAYTTAPLAQLLGIRDGFRIAAVNPPPGYWSRLGDLPPSVSVERPHAAGLNCVHLFVRDRRELVPWLKKLRRRIVPNGMIWVSWPRRASRIATNLERETVRRLGIRTGLVDTRACAVDDDWNGVKFVIRLPRRG